MPVLEQTHTAHIRVDDGGIARIGNTRVSVMDIVLDRTAYGLLPEQIAQEYDGLSLAQIYAALAWYYDHQVEVDAEIERRFRIAEDMRASAEPSPAIKRLRESRRR
jgi:uncharacterized protein (DUF433 family)